MSLNSFFLLSIAQANAGNNVIFPELSNIFNWAIGIGVILALISIIYSGIIYTISAGNESKKGQAIGRIKETVLGMAFLISAFILLRTIDPNVLSPQAKIRKLPELRIQQPPDRQPIPIQGQNLLENNEILLSEANTAVAMIGGNATRAEIITDAAGNPTSIKIHTPLEGVYHTYYFGRGFE